jgi:hypothetical protein
MKIKNTSAPFLFVWALQFWSDDLICRHRQNKKEARKIQLSMLLLTTFQQLLYKF